MTNAALQRASRKALVVGATATVIGGGALCVEYAANWRAAAAPLDTVPVSATSASNALEAERQRTKTLTAQLDQVTLQLGDLQTALDSANGAMAGQNDAAAGIDGQLQSATAKLAKVQTQLTAAQNRLTQLNAAAAKQAALNAAAKRTATRRVVTTTGASGRVGGDDD